MLSSDKRSVLPVLSFTQKDAVCSSSSGAAHPDRARNDEPSIRSPNNKRRTTEPLSILRPLKLCWHHIFVRFRKAVRLEGVLVSLDLNAGFSHIVIERADLMMPKQIVNPAPAQRPIVLEWQLDD